MRTLPIAFFFATFVAIALAQDSVPATSACGAERVSFNVKLDKSHPPLPKTEPGKATVVFIQEIGAQHLRIGEHVVGKIGIDGTWVGAVRKNSYFSVPIEPGEHHICLSMESELPEFAHFKAEAGEVYYFRSLYAYEGSNLLLAPVDSDEAKYAIATFPLSVSMPKK